MLHRFSQFLVGCTVLLVLAGSLVTSTGSGLAVPDWPTTYGWNMFTFPPSKWVGGIFYEHGHRLIASTVGFLTIILAAWIWLADPRRWLRRLGLAALAAVVATAGHIWYHHRQQPELTRPALLIVGLVAIQVTLGALTVLSRRDVAINSAHVVCGALLLTTSLVLALRTWRAAFEKGLGSRLQMRPVESRPLEATRGPVFEGRA